MTSHKTILGPDFEGVVQPVSGRFSTEADTVITLDAQALDAAMDEAGSGWAIHLDRNEKRWLMGRAITAYLASLPAKPEAPAGQVVKALEWANNSADTPIGVYTIYPPNGSDSRSYYRLFYPYDGLTRYDTLELAKAAAQADFETRILSALLATPPAPTGLAEYKAKNAKHGWSGRGFSFDPGFLNLNCEGDANIGFAEADMQYERDDETGKDYVYCNVPVSEILALRDYLIEAFPPATKRLFKCAYCNATFDDPTTLCGLEKCDFSPVSPAPTSEIGRSSLQGTIDGMWYMGYDVIAHNIADALLEFSGIEFQVPSGNMSRSRPASSAPKGPLPKDTSRFHALSTADDETALISEVDGEVLAYELWLHFGRAFGSTPPISLVPAARPKYWAKHPDEDWTIQGEHEDYHFLGKQCFREAAAEIIAALASQSTALSKANTLPDRDGAVALREALEKIAAGYDGEDGRRLIPLAELGAELRRRQNIARAALQASSRSAKP